jgi:hypothetical protein
MIDIDYPGATRHLIPPLLSTRARYQYGTSKVSWILTLYLRLLLPSLILQYQPLQLLPLCQTLLLIVLQVDGDVRIHRDIK